MSERTMILLDHEVTVSLDDPGVWVSDGMGRCSIKSSSIHVAIGMTPDTTQCTFLHELLHMITGMNSIELKATDIDALALGIFSFLKNNPDMAGQEWITRMKGQ